MKEDLYREQIETYLNGNISDFKKFVLKLSKEELINLLHFLSCNQDVFGDVLSCQLLVSKIRDWQ